MGRPGPLEEAKSASGLVPAGFYRLWPGSGLTTRAAGGTTITVLPLVYLPVRNLPAVARQPQAACGHDCGDGLSDNFNFFTRN